MYYSSQKERNPFRCIICGKFFSYHEDFYIWTPYGGYEDTEPPEPERAHKKCYDNYNRKQLIIDTSWYKPVLQEWIKYETSQWKDNIV
jgi:hypothetical protein